MNEILVPALTIGALGLVFGTLLSVVFQKNAAKI